MDQVSFYAGMFGIAAYAIAMFPQYYKNYKLKNVEGLSAGLVVIWLCGDICNLAGTILSNQLPTQRLTASYFVLTDVLMVCQYVWYKYMYKQCHPSDSGYQAISTSEEVQVDIPAASHMRASFSSDTSAARPRSGSSHSIVAAAAIGSAAALVASLAQGVDARNLRFVPLLVELAPICNIRNSISDWNMILGSIFSWCSGLFYFTSRIPQVLENYKRKSVQGISMLLFGLTILGNLGYSLSIMLRFPNTDTYFWAATFPYILGSVGVLAFDGIIFLQAIQYDEL
ncbi:hypothetical protein BASA61_003250 [Batrachochytrium salamandrivorans]|nr:hypothetical protein BASA62_009431 [Batrachochytrium salamandrivorans]KAH6568370.1 hypothetical protein BASA60_008673 [Batrachochytrium salamandrivorans]KAH6597115.1 hypothetical protein BASA61_003250 [Batrachochytrium salamandrivorans]KAJ1330304.1 hypothetical protein BSLG_009440 [Batrachochytrium salamandrivorans]KAJ1344435.1 hypothetical protein BSLG_000995 [Batrachochytrium salamandrivorans]